MFEKMKISARLGRAMSVSLAAAAVAGAVPGAALAHGPMPQPQPVAEALATPEAATEFQARVAAAIAQLRAANPSIGQGDAARLHLAQWRNG